MIVYKYLVHDDDHKISDQLFDEFADAFDYAQEGLITFIEEYPIEDGVEGEGEIVWTWDDTHSREDAIASVYNRHPEESIPYIPEDPDLISKEEIGLVPDEIEEISETEEIPVEENLEVEITADEPEEIVSLAKCILGGDCDSFDLEFSEPVESEEVEVKAAEFPGSDDEPKECPECKAELPENPFDFDFEIKEESLVDKAPEAEQAVASQEKIATEAPEEGEECDPHKVGPLNESEEDGGELEDDWSDEEFVEAFGKAMKEKHGKEELEEANRGYSWINDKVEPGIQYSMDDYDENGEIKPEVEKAIKKRLDLEKKAAEKDKVVSDISKDYDDHELKQKVKAAKKEYDKAIGTGKQDEKEKIWSDLVKELAQKKADYDVAETQRKAANKVLNNDRKNNKYITDTNSAELYYDRKNAQGFEDNYTADRRTPDENRIGKVGEYDYVGYTNARDQENDKLAGQEWFEFDAEGDAKLMKRTETDQSKKRRQDKIDYYKDRMANTDDKSSKQAYKQWIHDEQEPNIRRSVYNDEEVVDEPVKPELSEVDQILSDLEAGKITRAEAAERLKK